VRIVHRKFGDKEASEREIFPLFLKQFQQRWYLVAREAKSKRIKSFGLERIEEFELLPHTFRARAGETHEKLYGHVFGLFEREHNPVLVRLWSSRFHANYLRTLPLHPSQEEDSQELDGGVVFTFFLTPNYEFFQAILKMETHVRILSPESAVNGLRKMLKEMLDLYK
jgi:predicted DNA-binding transcriptional regulator YafY